MEQMPITQEQIKEAMFRDEVDLENTIKKYEEVSDKINSIKLRLENTNSNNFKEIIEIETELSEFEKTSKKVQMEIIGHMRRSMADYELSIKRSTELSLRMKSIRLSIEANYKSKQLKLNGYLASSIGALLILGKILSYSKLIVLSFTAVTVFVVAIIYRYIHFNKTKYNNSMKEIEEIEFEIGKTLELQGIMIAKNERMSEMLVQMEKGGAA